MASITANATKRSENLLPNLVRISRDLLSRLLYTSRSLFASLALSSLQLGSDFHNFRSLLPCCKHRLAGGRACSVCQVAISLRLSYMPCGLFSCVFVCQGTPNGVCTTHIVTTQEGCRRGEAR